MAHKTCWINVKQSKEYGRSARAHLIDTSIKVCVRSILCLWNYMCIKKMLSSAACWSKRKRPTDYILDIMKYNTMPYSMIQVRPDLMQYFFG